MSFQLQSVQFTPENWLYPFDLRGLFPHPERPVEIDLGCGKGRFLRAHAAAHPDVNVFGIDRMLRRIKKVDRAVRRQGLENVRLFRMDAYYATTFLVPPSCVRTYYVFFPDPWPKARHAAHRLFNEPFNEALHRTLEPGGCIHVATDHLPYYEQIARLLREDPRWQPVPPFVPPDEERTDFECLFLGHKPIGRCSYRNVP